MTPLLICTWIRAKTDPISARSLEMVHVHRWAGYFPGSLPVADGMEDIGGGKSH